MGANIPVDRLRFSAIPQGATKPCRAFPLLFVSFFCIFLFSCVLSWLGRVHGGKTIWCVISGRPHGSGTSRCPFSLLSHGLSMCPRSEGNARRRCLPAHTCASVVCLVCVFSPGPISFPSCNPSALGRLLMRDGDRPVRFGGLPFLPISPLQGIRVLNGSRLLLERTPPLSWNWVRNSGAVWIAGSTQPVSSVSLSRGCAPENV